MRTVFPIPGLDAKKSSTCVLRSNGGRQASANTIAVNLCDPRLCVMTVPCGRVSGIAPSVSALVRHAYIHQIRHRDLRLGKDQDVLWNRTRRCLTFSPYNSCNVSIISLAVDDARRHLRSQGPNSSSCTHFRGSVTPSIRQCNKTQRNNMTHPGNQAHLQDTPLHGRTHYPLITDSPSARSACPHRGTRPTVRVTSPTRSDENRYRHIVVRET
ncbi:hypothetical protein L210DRAFT_2603635 [Boletus edulis BED1]|uniref:Uncharacterized protein n=1 Tax=Boletus edulis BED1 TaxID=1328754 RepID=A0AAD4BMH4_BOLED|nr:hypothetical protein L210DRAFT_2603635 [Boletus edulis BED1]